MNADSPCSHRLVHATLRGIRRVKGMKQRRVSALTVEDLRKLVDVIPTDLKGSRDRALLLIGFAGAFRRSELTGIAVDDLQFVPEGVITTIRRSKTDQNAVGRQVAIPNAQSKMCPVNALRDWLRVAVLNQGAVFRRFATKTRLSSEAITPASVALTIKRYARMAGLDAAQYSGHSLRSGLVTSAARAGVSLWKIRKQTGHCSDAMVQRYIRESNLFSGNATGQLL